MTQNRNREFRVHQLSVSVHSSIRDMAQAAAKVAAAQLAHALKPRGEAAAMLAIVPEKRKVQAVFNSLFGPVSMLCPGSFLRTQPPCTVYLDPESASLLPGDL